MDNITPVILAGGSGSRLWPLSRKSYPKQFSDILGNNTLFQETAIRLSSSNILKFDPLVILTNSNFRFIVGQQLESVGIDKGQILIEPDGKNTGPAILAACMFLLQKNKDAILLIAPSDHVIPDINYFHQAIATGLHEVKKGHIVTFGISPTRPETGYGYLELLKNSNGEAVKLKKFIEKPNFEEATKMIEKGTFLWNAGIFMCSAKEMVSAFKKYAPNLIDPVHSSIIKGKKDLGFFRLDPIAWAKCENISIDFAVMEQSTNVVAIPYSSSWSDLGGWDAVWDKMLPNEKGVALSKNAHEIDCKNTLLRSESNTQEVVGIGLENIIAIAMPDAVLVAHMSQSQQVKKVVSELKLKGLPQSEIFPKDHRPWGWFETLAITDRYQVKRIVVYPGEALSLQSHHHRSEHWIVVAGTAKITINKTTKLITEGESVYIPLGAIHRMENPGKLRMMLIEVQTGSYLGEDDIIRYEDLYKR